MGEIKLTYSPTSISFTPSVAIQIQRAVDLYQKQQEKNKWLDHHQSFPDWLASKTEIPAFDLNMPMLRSIDVVMAEVLYGKEKWNQIDQDKGQPMEFWITHMENYLLKARLACTGPDTSDVSTNLRKVAGLLMRCFELNGVIGREMIFTKSELGEMLSDGVITLEQYKGLYATLAIPKKNEPSV